MWCQGSGEDWDGRRCLVGAVCAVTEDEHTGTFAALDALNKVVREQYPHLSAPCIGHHNVVAFNDHPDTTWADVDLVLDKAARRLDEQL